MFNVSGYFKGELPSFKDVYHKAEFTIHPVLFTNIRVNNTDDLFSEIPCPEISTVVVNILDGQYFHCDFSS